MTSALLHVELVRKETSKSLLKESPVSEVKLGILAQFLRWAVCHRRHQDTCSDAPEHTPGTLTLAFATATLLGFHSRVAWTCSLRFFYTETSCCEMSTLHFLSFKVSFFYHSITLWVFVPVDILCTSPGQVVALDVAFRSPEIPVQLFSTWI